MRHLIIIFNLLFCFISFNNEDTLLWHENLKLTWDDFKGEQNVESNAVAVTASGITFSYKVRKANSKIIDFTPSVEAHFYPQKSWVKLELADDYILAHEQLHFDITELHVRKLKKQISALKVTQNLGSILDKLHRNINNELSKMQNQYDSESINSINKEVQNKWEAFIAKELKIYEAYK